MTPVASTIQAFFSDRLAGQLQASPRTIASYRDTLRLLLHYTHQQTGKPPCALDWEDLDEELISGFLEQLETVRGNAAKTRNLRLTAIRALFTFASLRHPEHANTIARVLAIPPKRHQQRSITYLSAPEAAALIDAPDGARWEGRRDRTLLTLANYTGLRVSELTGSDCGDITLGTGANVRCRHSKGRKQRAVPLITPVRPVLTERAGQPNEALFPTRSGRRLSSDAIAQRLNTHAATAAITCPSLNGKHLHPHVLRHSCAMSLLQAGVDTTVIALWLGHADVRSTDPYIHADMTIKEKALALVTPPNVKPGRYKPPDDLLAFREGL
jgi:site-specific recombinase XerD